VNTDPSFFERLSIAFKLFFRVLGDPGFASRMMRMEPGEKAPSAPRPAKTPVFTEAPPDAAIQLLGLLQQEGRFIDFLEEDITGVPDPDIGAAARVVHQGCRKAVRDHFKIIPIRTEQEGSRVTLPEGFDASCVRLAGNVVGKPPYNGSLIHRGWRVSDVTLPKIAAGHDVRVLASAEVEL
jgi:hypothetical protein